MFWSETIILLHMILSNLLAVSNYSMLYFKLYNNFFKRTIM